MFSGVCLEQFITSQLAETPQLQSTRTRDSKLIKLPSSNGSCCHQDLKVRIARSMSARVESNIGCRSDAIDRKSLETRAVDFGYRSALLPNVTISSSKEDL